MAKFEDFILRGIAATRPAAGVPGRLFFDTTNEKFQRDTGAAWEDCDPAAGMTNPMTAQGDIIYGSASGAPTRLAKGTAGQVLRINSGATAPEWAASPTGNGLYAAYICIVDKKAQNTSGGTFTSGSWSTRTLTDELHDTGNYASISSNQITLAAGTYRCEISCPAIAVHRHQTRLYNVTDSAVVLTGTSEFSNSTNYNSTSSFIRGRFTLAAQKNLEVQHRCERTQSINGYGVESNFGDEIYTIVELWKES